MNLDYSNPLIKAIGDKRGLELELKVRVQAGGREKPPPWACWNCRPGQGGVGWSVSSWLWQVEALVSLEPAGVASEGQGTAGAGPGGVTSSLVSKRVNAHSGPRATYSHLSAQPSVNGTRMV